MPWYYAPLLCNGAIRRKTTILSYLRYQQAEDLCYFGRKHECEGMEDVP